MVTVRLLELPIGVLRLLGQPFQLPPLPLCDFHTLSMGVRQPEINLSQWAFYAYWKDSTCLTENPIGVLHLLDTTLHFHFAPSRHLLSMGL